MIKYNKLILICFCVGFTLLSGPETTRSQNTDIEMTFMPENTGNRWFGGDFRWNQEPTQYAPRQIPAAQSVYFPEEVLVKEFSFFLVTDFQIADRWGYSGSHEVTLTLHVRDNSGLILETQTVTLSDDFDGGWVTWNGLNTHATADSRLIFSAYVNDALNQHLWSLISIDYTESFLDGEAFMGVGSDPSDADLADWTNWRTASGDYCFRVRGQRLNTPPIPAISGYKNSLVMFEGESVTLDAGASHDPDGDPLTYTWEVKSPENCKGVVASEKGQVTTFTAYVACDYSLILRVFDPFTSTKLDFKIQVLTLENAIDSIGEQVIAVVGDNSGEATSAMQKLGNALRSMDRDNISAAAGQLGAFINEVNALINSGRITPEAGAALIESVERVIAQLKEEEGSKIFQEAVAEAFVLRQNYPNPFNPVTTIAFDVPYQSHVSLSVFDMLGRIVGTLLDAEVTPGTHTLQIDARDWSSGTYIYRLTTSDKVLSRAFTLLK